MRYCSGNWWEVIKHTHKVCQMRKTSLTAPGSSRNPRRACPERGRNSRFPIVLCSSKFLSIVFVVPTESKSPERGGEGERERRKRGREEGEGGRKKRGRDEGGEREGEEEDSHCET